jgi:small subunit ribosomal protein S5
MGALAVVRLLGARGAAARGMRGLYTPPPFEAPPAPLGLSEAESAGRDLAKLALMARATRETIAESGAAGLFTPDLLVELEATVDEANALVEDALRKAGRPCTLGQLADRVNADVLPMPKDALDFQQLLRAGNLRDELEVCLVHMNVLPPKEALIDGSGKPFCRLERKERRRREFEELESLSGGAGAPANRTTSKENRTDRQASRRPHGLPVLSKADLERRKADLEAALSLENILRGYETALLEVSRVNKVTRGGTTQSMRALVVIGNRAGTAGYGEGKSQTPAHAIERACRDATRNLMFVDRYRDRTIYHNAVGKYVRSRVTLWPAPEGRGISANNNFAAIFQLFGIKDVGAKLHGPRSLINSVKALFNGLNQIRSAEEIASTRGFRLVQEPERRTLRDRHIAIKGACSQFSASGLS